jgi:hypothetical protein
MELSWFTFTASGSFYNPQTTQPQRARSRPTETETVDPAKKREARNREREERGSGKGGYLAEVGGGDAGEVEPARGAGGREHGYGDEEERHHRAGRRHGWPGMGEGGGWWEGGVFVAAGRGCGPLLGFDGCPWGGWRGFR